MVLRYTGPVKSEYFRGSTEDLEYMRANSLLIRVGVVAGKKSGYNIASLGISLAVGQRTLNLSGQVRILDPQP